MILKKWDEEWAVFSSTGELQSALQNCRLEIPGCEGEAHKPPGFQAALCPGEHPMVAGGCHFLLLVRICAVAAMLQCFKFHSTEQNSHQRSELYTDSICFIQRLLKGPAEPDSSGASAQPRTAPQPAGFAQGTEGAVAPPIVQRPQQFLHGD